MNTMSRTPLVAGNWKMNGSRELAGTFSDTLNANSVEGVDVVICPPSVFLTSFEASAFALGGQDVSALDNGAHTGDVSTGMLAECGCDYVIVGHSERRQDHGESSELVAQKAARVLSANLTPIVCIGEPLDVREAGESALQEYLGKQLAALTKQLSPQDLSGCVIAYEPIWAIGTGKTASPEQAQNVHAYIRATLAETDEAVADGMRILYGGSVKADNAEALFSQPDVDGGLIGGASLKADDFMTICQAAK
ncbi:triose-phosphate isomerase [Alteromonas sp. ASW11-19]|uniref:Triosephosphate isomerase n=1 Tax=Alteromonas salexigens TaxID=2982530 RepID=A0ABT2VQ04_9ALTE|nr:triose-phosphate isomerase [Alteromonas salexigens]MCU7554321.1 triose-phosphate isomerase [Alteromonas salexigens]